MNGIEAALAVGAVAVTVILGVAGGTYLARASRQPRNEDSAGSPATEYFVVRTPETRDARGEGGGAGTTSEAPRRPPSPQDP
jgi:hypothetical protein